MKYFIILIILLSSCTSASRITSSNFTEPEVVYQPDIIEPISYSIGDHLSSDTSQTNDVFLKICALVIIICMLSVLPKFIIYLKAKLGRYPSDQDNE